MKKEDVLYKLNNINFSYSLGSHHIEALRDVNLDIPAQSLITVSGPSGSGKSTLLNILGLIEPVQSGQMLFQGNNIAAKTQKEMDYIRRYKIGFIFQQFHLIPVFNAEENIAYFLSRQGLSKQETKNRSQKALADVGLWQHRLKKPAELSGGQRQRVAIARAIAKHPQVIIGDEPTASLDQGTGKEIMLIFNRLIEQQGVSIVLTTHDKMVQEYAQKNFHLHDGMFNNGVI